MFLEYLDVVHKMAKTQILKTIHAPNLDTLLMVEETLKNMPNSVMRIAELKRALPRKVNHNTLLTILDYLDKSNKICIGVRGIAWIFNENSKLRTSFENSTEH